MQLESKAKTSLIINIILIMYHNSCQNVIFRQKNNVQKFLITIRAIISVLSFRYKYTSYDRIGVVINFFF